MLHVVSLRPGRGFVRTKPVGDRSSLVDGHRLLRLAPFEDALLAKVAEGFRERLPQEEVRARLLEVPGWPPRVRRARRR